MDVKSLPAPATQIVFADDGLPGLLERRDAPARWGLLQ